LLTISMLTIFLILFLFLIAIYRSKFYTGEGKERLFSRSNLKNANFIQFFLVHSEQLFVLVFIKITPSQPEYS